MKACLSVEGSAVVGGGSGGGRDGEGRWEGKGGGPRKSSFRKFITMTPTFPGLRSERIPSCIFQVADLGPKHGRDPWQKEFLMPLFSFLAQPPDAFHEAMKRFHY